MTEEIIEEIKTEEITENVAEEATVNNVTFTDAINEIKAEYELKIARINEEHSKALNERNEVIKQLLTADNTANPAETIVDKINKNRNFKKW